MLTVAVISVVGLIVFQPIDMSGAGLERGHDGTVDSISYKEDISSFKIGIQGDEEDSFRNTDCLGSVEWGTGVRAKCAECKEDCAAHNANPAKKNRQKDCGTSNGDACYSACKEDKCEDDHQTIYEAANPVEKTYFGKDYNCVQVSVAAMSGLSFALENMRDDDDRYVKGYATVSSLSLSWGNKGSISWSYPCIPTGTPKDWSTAVKTLLSGAKFNGIAFSTCSVAGWDVTNIQYVASDNTTASIRTLAESGYFDIITGVGLVKATQAQIDQCQTTCPAIYKSCRKVLGKKKCTTVTAPHDTCINACTTIQAYSWKVNGVLQNATPSNPYPSLAYDGTDTLLLFKDPTARIYSADKDFNFLADMRGGTGATLLCAYIPPTCGDGTCNGNDTCRTCDIDCGVCEVVAGDGYCDNEENCLGSAIDCACSDNAVCDPNRATNSSGCFELTAENLETICNTAGFRYTNTTCNSNEKVHDFMVGASGLTLEATPTGKCCEPYICTQEQLLCPDGSSMPRAVNCTWEIEKCPPVVVILPNGSTNETNASEISYCGDGACDQSNETCSSCPGDCNACVACSQASDCKTSLAYGIDLEGAGTWSCEANTCLWHDDVVVDEPGSSGDIEGIPSWVFVLLGGGLIVAIFYFILRK